MTELPQNIRVLKQARVIEIVWSDGRGHRFPFKFLRCQCPCASCVNELTGERILDPATVSADVFPQDVELCGNYALKIHWSDDHSSGIFTWEQLQQLTFDDAVQDAKLT